MKSSTLLSTIRQKLNLCMALCGICALPFLSMSQNSHEFYVYNNGKDTLFLVKVSGGQCNCDSLSIVKEAQIDGKGAKEILIRRTCSTVSEVIDTSHIYRERAEITQYEIWNTDTKQLLFEAVNDYSGEFSYYSPDGMALQERGKDIYSYTLDLSDKGRITIGAYHGNGSIRPDHSPGVYKYSAGKFRKKR